jgi:ubiquinone/menaquinone biosynthesis C-methylase UbiE
VPNVEFLEVDLRSLPVADASIDLVVCSLALTHLPELDGVFAEFARVLHSGGTAIISNIHYLAMLLNGVPKVRTPSGATIHAPASPFLVSDYTNAAIRSGFEIRSCAEPTWPDLDGGHGGPIAQQWCPGSVDAACIGTPALIALELGRR